MQIKLNDSEFKSFLKNVDKWASKDVEIDLANVSEEIAKKYQSQIRSGLAGDNSSLKSIKVKTLAMPIRYSSDRTLRKNVNSSLRPLVARGGAVNSIKSKKVADRFEIGPSTNHGKAVFVDNAFPRGNKAKRDPLIISKVQEQMIEDAILKSLDKAIRRL